MITPALFVAAFVFPSPAPDMAAYDAWATKLGGAQSVQGAYSVTNAAGQVVEVKSFRFLRPGLARYMSEMEGPRSGNETFADGKDLFVYQPWTPFKFQKSPITDKTYGYLNTSFGFESFFGMKRFSTVEPVGEVEIGGKKVQAYTLKRRGYIQQPVRLFIDPKANELVGWDAFRGENVAQSARLTYLHFNRPFRPEDLQVKIPANEKYLVPPVYTERLIALKPGDQAPDITIRDFRTGAPVSLKSLFGKAKYTLLSFPCYHCGTYRTELPPITLAYEQLKAKGVQGFIIEKKADLEDIDKYFQREGFSMPLMLDSEAQDGNRLYRTKATSSAYLVDSTGKILYASGPFVDIPSLFSILQEQGLPVTE